MHGFKKLAYTLSLVVVTWLVTPSWLLAQRMDPSYQNYIVTWANEAIMQMAQHKIPASVTMAQGLLESGAGRSMLALKHNNHFGIKCHNTWQGKRAYKDDDLENECFRSYSSAYSSWQDHAEVLKKPRYQSLYNLDLTDYAGWAKGLQRCGYATDKGYANRLIAIIELYQLYELDRRSYPSWMNRPNSSLQQLPRSIEERQRYNCYGLEYVLAFTGDSFASIARDLGMSAKKLARYNDAPEEFPLVEGDVIYIECKNKKGPKETPSHTIQVGDSMHSISQQYGIRLEYLYWLNGLDMESYVPVEGDTLRLR